MAIERWNFPKAGCSSWSVDSYSPVTRLIFWAAGCMCHECDRSIERVLRAVIAWTVVGAIKALSKGARNVEARCVEGTILEKVDWGAA